MRTLTVTFLNGNTTTNPYYGNKLSWLCSCGLLLFRKGYNPGYHVCPACDKKYRIEADEGKRVVNVVEVA